MSARFVVGDAVQWTSQAGGYAKEKSGTVAEVVPAGRYPDRNRFPSLYRHAGVGMSRDHESYVVHVPGKTARGVGTAYWPRAAALLKA